MKNAKLYIYSLLLLIMSCGKTNNKLQVDILGEMYDATVIEESPYDSENNLLRA